MPLVGEDETPVEFVPPDGLRPGQVGTLVDFKANPLDVTATIVDLAVRGYLTIEETQEKGLFRAGDWKLAETDKGKAVTDDGELLPYERTLLNGLFRDGSSVQLSDLHNTFATRMSNVQQALVNDAIKRKWFVGKPGTMRALWALIGIAVVVIGVALTIVLAAFTHAALIGIPVIIGGLVLTIGSKWMPHRTAKGYSVLRRVDGFRRFIDESEKERARFAERRNLFSEYLPYAVVFGATKKWAERVRGPRRRAARHVGLVRGAPRVHVCRVLRGHRRVQREQRRHAHVVAVHFGFERVLERGWLLRRRWRWRRWRLLVADVRPRLAGPRCGHGILPDGTSAGCEDHRARRDRPRPVRRADAVRHGRRGGARRSRRTRSAA